MGTTPRTDKMTHLYIYHILATFWTRGKLRHMYTRKSMNLTVKMLRTQIVYMTSFKLTISDTKGKSLTKELKDAEAIPLLGLEVGAEADATIVGFEGKIKITGGSDKSGVPMRQFAMYILEQG